MVRQTVAAFRDEIEKIALRLFKPWSVVTEAGEKILPAVKPVAKDLSGVTESMRRAHALAQSRPRTVQPVSQFQSFAANLPPAQPRWGQ